MRRFIAGAALTYVPGPTSHPQWAGRLAPEEAARLIARGQGSSGPGWEYLENWPVLEKEEVRARPEVAPAAARTAQTAIGYAAAPAFVDEPADHVIDFGPGAGKHGGQIVAAGSPVEVSEQPGSLTGDYLAGRASIPVPQKRRSPEGKAIILRGARHHNLQNITVRLPLGLLVAVTGVSGSGKSSLVFDILDRAVRKQLNGSSKMPGEHDAIEGIGHLDKIITIDQEHIGRIPRSNAATLIA